MSTYTELQTALINAGVSKLVFTNSGKTFERDIATTPDASIVKVLMSGRRAFNDACNGAADKEAMQQAWLSKYDSGEWGTRVTAQAMSPFDKAMFDTVLGLLKQTGLKAKDARELLKEVGVEKVCTELLKMNAKQLDALHAHAEKLAELATFTLPAMDTIDFHADDSDNADDES